MTVDAFVTQPHYVDHVAPIWWALTPDERGTFYVSRNAEARARREGLWPLAVGRPQPTRSATPTIVAAYVDLRGIHRPAIFVEHGAGQTYGGDPKGRRDASYSGGAGRDQVRLFLAPNDAVHQRNLEGTPHAASVVVGVPKLDWWHRPVPGARAPGTAPTVALSFHWDCTLVPETRTTWPFYNGVLDALAVVARARGWRLLGHGHPRIFARLERRWRQLGIEPVADFDQVLREASVYVCDNSSTLPEAGACGIPLVWLSAPWYRREVEHGGRFWDWPKGQVHVEGPGELIEGIERALVDPPMVRLARRQMAHGVFPLFDGRAAERAAQAIRDHGLTT